mmetsp:Transcript_47390/g.122962  ORF Transcript_47390/g.122962 Transcript_47390/m.122962 type:complete len:346 (+) Transcript_47390:1082-2119(+)
MRGAADGEQLRAGHGVPAGARILPLPAKAPRKRHPRLQGGARPPRLGRRARGGRHRGARGLQCAGPQGLLAGRLARDRPGRRCARLPARGHVLPGARGLPLRPRLLLRRQRSRQDDGQQEVHSERAVGGAAARAAGVRPGAVRPASEGGRCQLRGPHLRVRGEGDLHLRRRQDRRRDTPRADLLLGRLRELGQVQPGGHARLRRAGVLGRRDGRGRADLRPGGRRQGERGRRPLRVDERDGEVPCPRCRHRQKPRGREPRGLRGHRAQPHHHQRVWPFPRGGELPGGRIAVPRVEGGRLPRHAPLGEGARPGPTRLPQQHRRAGRALVVEAARGGGRRPQRGDGR